MRYILPGAVLVLFAVGGWFSFEVLTPAPQQTAASVPASSASGTPASQQAAPAERAVRLPADESADPVVAVVDGWEIPLSYVHGKIQSVPLADQIDVRGELDRFVDSVIHEEVLLQHAIKQAGQDPAWRDRMKNLVVTALIEDRVRGQVTITDEDIKAYYKEHVLNANREHLRVRHLPVADRARCEEIGDGISSDGQLAEAAKEHHRNKALALEGGDLGYVMRTSSALGFEEELFDLPLNTLHRLERNGDCHLIWISEKVVSDVPKLEEIKNDLRQGIQREREAELLQQLLASARSGVTVERRELPK